MILSPWFWLSLLAAAAIHHVLAERVRIWALAGISFAFLFWFAAPGNAVLGAGLSRQQVSLIVFLGWAVACWLLAPTAVHNRNVRRGLILGLLGYLAYYKYVPAILGAITGQPLTGSIIVPLGISYFTFKLIHFVVDLGRRGARHGTPGEFITYLFLFPAFTAGPIERFDHFLANRRTRADAAMVVSGVTRICVGLVKKFAVVDLVLKGWIDDIDPLSLATSTDTGMVAAWSYLIAWYLYVYIDFSAYTDIALGSARLFGIELMENFNWPIFASNIGAFWKRWHMTLANWCQSYVYLPVIGLTRNPYVAVFATFLAIGVWHGASANWVLWGLYHGAGVATYLSWTRAQRKKGPPSKQRNVRWYVLNTFSMAVTGLFVSAGFAFSATHVDGKVWQQVPVAFRLLGKCLGLV